MQLHLYGDSVMRKRGGGGGRASSERGCVREM